MAVRGRIPILRLLVGAFPATLDADALEYAKSQEVARAMIEAVDATHYDRIVKEARTGNMYRALGFLKESAPAGHVGDGAALVVEELEEDEGEEAQLTDEDVSNDDSSWYSDESDDLDGYDDEDDDEDDSYYPGSDSGSDGDEAEGEDVVVVVDSRISNSSSDVGTSGEMANRPGEGIDGSDTLVSVTSACSDATGDTTFLDPMSSAPQSVKSDTSGMERPNDSKTARMVLADKAAEDGEDGEDAVTAIDSSDEFDEFVDAVATQTLTAASHRDEVRKTTDGSAWLAGSGYAAADVWKTIAISLFVHSLLASSVVQDMIVSITAYVPFVVLVVQMVGRRSDATGTRLAVLQVHDELGKQGMHLALD
ncbi:hypothetical protein BC831DRAFT_468744 [Entophlyctis helioformis]|nr:hypothetical protein BC831DRAFT_468744 [Entophlyctis helioformis]